MKIIEPNATWKAALANETEATTLNWIEVAARNCYKSEMSKDPKSRLNFLNALKKAGHLSVFEHSQIVIKFVSQIGWSCFKAKAFRSGKYRFFDINNEHSVVGGNLRVWLEFFKSETFAPIQAELHIKYPNIFDEPEEDTFSDCYCCYMLGREQVFNKFPEMVRHLAYVTTDRGVLAEFTRHRTLSFSAESTRYCDYSSADGIKVIKEKFTDWGPAFETIESFWLEACLDSDRIYYMLRDCGVRPQMARQVLNHSLATTFYVSGLPEFWNNFFELRTSSKAHPNIRMIAKKLLENKEW